MILSRHAGEPTFYDDAKDLVTFGGSEYMASFRGYIGQATIYRNKIVNPDKVCLFLAKYQQ
jgi:hypothetical protein